MLIFSLGSLAWLSAFKTSHFKAEITSIKRSQIGSREQLVHPAMAHIPSSPFNAFHHIQLISRLETDFTHVLKQMSEFKCSCVLILTLETRPVVLTDWTGRRTVVTGTSLLFSVDLTFVPDALTSRKLGQLCFERAALLPSTDKYPSIMRTRCPPTAAGAEMNRGRGNGGKDRTGCVSHINPPDYRC